MAAHLTRKVLTVFLASPGDVVAERKIARKVVDEINDTHSRGLGWHIELLGWEDTLPGVGRPQERINVEVDACDLFVGIVWKRWGSPTGKFDSGFHEEFERARARFKQTGKPERWLFFKQVKPDQLWNPEPQLKCVQAFRAEQIALREAQFKEFTNQKEWRSLFRDYLSRYLVELTSGQFRNSSSITTPAETQTTSVVPSSSIKSPSSASMTKEASIKSKPETFGKSPSGQVVVFPFPSANLAETKDRPVVVIADVGGPYKDLVYCMITSVPSALSIEITESDFQEGKLPRPVSYVRPDRVFTAQANLVVRPIGRLSASKTQEILDRLRRIFTYDHTGKAS